MSQQNPRNKVRMCQFCEYRYPVLGSDLCSQCDKKPLMELFGEKFSLKKSK